MMTRFAKVALMSALMVLVLYAIAAAPGFLSDQASTVPAQDR